MSRFFLSSSKIYNNVIIIDGDDAKHISRSLRMTVGEHITVCDMQQFEYLCEIAEITANTVIVNILSQKKNDTEPPYKVHLFQALPKGDKMDFIIQKAVEMGVYELTPFESQRCITKVNRESSNNKSIRWQKIASEAAKQCGRGIIPKINRPITFDDVLENATKFDLCILCYEGDNTTSLKDILKSKSAHNIMVVIGPEGGFSLNETALSKNRNFEIAGLGKRILRCETASGFVLACIAYEFEL